jgi:hypothetical protein
MNTQHTPGPWEISRHATPDYAPQYGVYTENNRHIATVRGDHAEEDARLIAAAPELLDVLQDVIEDTGTSGYWWGEKALDAINKATGN